MNTLKTKVADKFRKIRENSKLFEDIQKTPRFKPKEFNLLLECTATQRDFREFLITRGVPDLCVYVDFSIQCHRLNGITDPSEMIVKIEHLYDAHIRNRAMDKLDLNDFGMSKRQIDQKLERRQFGPNIFDPAVQQCANRLTTALKIFYRT